MTKLVYTNIFDAIAENEEQAADLQFRADLLLLLRDLCEKHGWGQGEIGAALDIPQPRVSELVNGKIDKFSSDKLIGFLDRLGYRFRPKFIAKPKARQPEVQCDVMMAMA